MSFPRYPKYKDSGVEWLGEVPEHWDLTRGRRLFVQTREPAKESDQQLSATQKYGVIPQSKFMELEDQKVTLALSGTENFKHVNIDDFVISLRSFQGGIEHSPYQGCVSPAYTIIRPCRSMYPPYWKYLLKSKGYIESLQAVTAGIRDGKNISYEQFGSVMVPIISVPEQRAIASFLDRETAKIDALVAEQQRLIELLQEKRQAVISHAVTKGLNPHASMKDSGIEWLGMVPEHWEVRTLKRLAENIKAGPFGSSLTKDMYVASGYRVYGQEQVIPNDFNLGDYFITADKFKELSQYQVSPGDILISCVGTFGKIAIVPNEAAPGVINPRLLRLRCLNSVSATYLLIILSSLVVFEQFAFLSRGGTMDVINVATLSSIQLVIPPLCEQYEITTFLKAESQKLDCMINEVTHAIDLLQERRTALISAAVTGKINITSVLECT